MELLWKRIGWKQLEGLQQRKNGAGRPAYRLSRGQLLAVIIFHFTVRQAGTLGEHLFWFLAIRMSESTLSERRQSLPVAVFEELLRLALRPLGLASPEAFYQGLRLVAIDGVTFSLPNTPTVQEQCRKGANQRSVAAFAKLQCAVLVELLMHNPLAAQIGWRETSEWKLAHGLLDPLPAKCLLLADRLYGCGAFLLEAQARLKELHGHFLVRVKRSIKVREIQRLPDGSRLVEVKALDPQDYHQVRGTLIVREIQARIRRRGHSPVELRLWTSLLDCEQAPAQELVELYIRRWEQELYFRELKSQLGVNNLLRSQTPETAAQEVAAMIIGSSIIAEQRSLLQPGQELAHRLSFLKVWEMMEPLWLTLLVGADILTEKQKQQLTDRFRFLASRRVMQKKRNRSCPRVIRQPFRQWPKKRNQKSSTAPLTISVLQATEK